MFFLPQRGLSWLSGGLALAVWLAGIPRSSAEAVSDYQVKAAYIYTFAKFVEWPSESLPNSGSQVRFCILNDRSFEFELNHIVKGKSIAGHSIDVVQVQDGNQARTCHVLFINSAQARQARRIIELLRGTSVLTVGEGADFLEVGGVITFVLEDDRVQFQVSQKAANAAKLYISSRLLSVAKRVVD